MALYRASTKEMLDVIIIGAGINGAGIARDAAMRGLKVLLLDKGDVGGGTSAWSTRLIHGGLRYLEHAEFGLVRESLRERETLLKIAPHLVKALPIVVPIYKGARRGRLKIRAGMIAYDLLSFDKTLPRHAMLSRTEALDRMPALEANGLDGAAVYYDGQVEFAERLVLENVLSAIEHGAQVKTYARVTKVLTHQELVEGVSFIDEETGSEQTAEARVVINAAGPWIDRVIGDAASSSRLIGGTKGSHIVVPNFHGAPADAIYVEASTDNRPFFIIPWNGKYLIGTTDLRYDGDPDHAQATDEEIDYLLRETNRVLPSANLNRNDVLFTYSGIRPLPFTGNKQEESITRRHFIRQHPRLNNLLSIVGGKLTTYRSLAEETVNLIEWKLNVRSQRCTTADDFLPGAGPDFSEWTNDFNQRSSLDERTRSRLVKIYGTRAEQVVKLMEDDPKLSEVFDDETGAVAAEIVYAFKHELAHNLADCLLRRTMVGLNSTCGLEAVEAAAAVGRKYLGWTDDRCGREIEQYRKAVERMRLVR